MKKLEDIPKSNPFTVPDGYFDKLPGIIQARVAKESPEARPYFRYVLQYAVPVITLIIVAAVYLVPKQTETVDTLLAAVSTEELAAYLEQSDLTTDELLDTAELDAESVEAIESEVYFKAIDLEDLTEYDVDPDKF